MKSIIGKNLLGQSATGTQYPTITDDDVRAMPIPIFPEDIIKNISNKVNETHTKRIEAKFLIYQAKHKVEEMVEKEA